MRPYRKEKVASVVRRIVSEAIVHQLHDPRVAPLTTVTRVEMTGDLLIAKVYLSVQGEGAAEERTLQAVRHAAGYLQRMVARELPVRQCPALRFEIDKRVKGTRRTMDLLAENRRNEPQTLGPEEIEEQKLPENNEAADRVNDGSSQMLSGTDE